MQFTTDKLTSFLFHDAYFPLLYHTLDLHVPLKWKTGNTMLSQMVLFPKKINQSNQMQEAFIKRWNMLSKLLIHCHTQHCSPKLVYLLLGKVI